MSEILFNDGQRRVINLSSDFGQYDMSRLDVRFDSNFVQFVRFSEVSQNEAFRLTSEEASAFVEAFRAYQQSLEQKYR